MLSQQNLIYLGIALLVVGIAFFAYQELQKHHTEIEKLRMQGHELRLQSQKLEKIIHAYNMRQWQQSNEYMNNDNDEHDDDDSSNNDSNDSNDSSESESSYNDEGDDDENNHRNTNTEHHVVNALLQQTLNSIGTPARTPTRVTVSTGGKTLQFPVVTPLNSLTPMPPAFQNRNERIEELPVVDSFDVLHSNNGNQTPDSPSSNSPVSPRFSHHSPRAPITPQSPRSPIKNDTFSCAAERGTPGFQTVTEKPTSLGVAQSTPQIVTSEPLHEMEQEDEESMIGKDVRKNEEREKEESDILQSQETKPNNIQTQKGCSVKIKGGERKGETCGNPIKINGVCLRHFRSENKN